jgi:hypothetical protein
MVSAVAEVAFQKRERRDRANDGRERGFACQSSVADPIYIDAALHLEP